MQDGGLDNTWLMDSGCSRHMTGYSKWFSSLTLVTTKEYITFGDNSKGKVVSRGTIWVNDSFVPKDMALVTNLHFNLLSVSQILDEGLEVCFKKHASHILDSRGDLICNLLLYGRVFKADFSLSFGYSFFGHMKMA